MENPTKAFWFYSKYFSGVLLFLYTISTLHQTMIMSWLDYCNWWIPVIGSHRLEYSSFTALITAVYVCVNIWLMSFSIVYKLPMIWGHFILWLIIYIFDGRHTLINEWELWHNPKEVLKKRWMMFSCREVSGLSKSHVCPMIFYPDSSKYVEMWVKLVDISE